MQLLAEYGLFLAKTLTVAIAVLMVGGGLATLSMRHRKAAEQRLKVTRIDKEFDDMAQALAGALLSPAQLKQKRKTDKRAARDKAKAEQKAEKRAKRVKKAADADADAKTKTESTTPGKRVYILDFNGDIRASAVASLRQEVSAVLTMAGGGDEVVVRLESGGGVVHGYGLAASQLQRIRAREIPLTVCVDKVAASGGYLMACVADKIIAAPFAVIGSIGVLAQLPNLHRLLQKHDVDFEQLHAGEYKRTLTLFGQNTDKAREKMQQDLEETHGLFKDYVKAQRPNLDIDSVSTGEHWYGARALELGLVDELQTSDDYLMAQRDHDGGAQLLSVSYTGKKKFLDRLMSMTRLGRLRGEESIDDAPRPMLL